jgi:hypothetical protein
MGEGHTPRLFLKVHSPEEPSEKLNANGIFGSLTIVAQPDSSIAALITVKLM